MEKTRPPVLSIVWRRSANELAGVSRASRSAGALLRDFCRSCLALTLAIRAAEDAIMAWFGYKLCRIFMK